MKRKTLLRDSNRTTLGLLLLLALTLLAPLPALASYSGALQTILIPATTNATNNGTALLNAVAAITDATGSKRYMIKLETGKYDIGTQILNMKQYVDIEGSGRKSTKILGQTDGNSLLAYPAILFGADDAELRNLSVIATAGEESLAIAIFLPGVDMRLLNVLASASGGSSVNDGIVAAGGTPRLESVIGTGYGGTTAAGMVIELGSIPILFNCELKGYGASDLNRGLSIRDQTPAGNIQLRSSTFQGIGGEEAYGLLATEGSSTSSLITVTNSAFAADGGSVKNRGIELGAALSLNLHASDSQGYGTSSYGLVTNSATARIVSSKLKGDTGPASGNSALWLSATGLYGGSVVGTGVVCAGVFDGSNTFYASTCP